MKIRNGFVSNSSSSSFVLIGYSIDDKYLNDIIWEFFSDRDDFPKKDNMSDDEYNEVLVEYFYYNKREKINSKNIRFRIGSDDGAPENKIIVGLDIELEDGFFECKEYDLDTIKSDLDSIKHKLRIDDDQNIKIFTGTFSC